MIKLIKSFLKAFLKIKIVKALIGVIVVLLGYKYIRYFIRFNKFIIYILGLLFVGIGWNDIYIFNELKLAYDSLKLYLLTFLPDNDVNQEIISKTKDDMKQIIYSDHTNHNGEIDNDYVYVFANKLEEVKSMKNEIKETTIIVGDDSWTWTEILTDPIIIVIIISATIATGTLILAFFDVTFDEARIYSWSHLKMGATATF